MTENSLVAEHPNGQEGLRVSLNDLDRLRRYLSLGSEEGTCYVGETSHNQAIPDTPNAECISRLIEAGRGKEVVEEIVSFSVSGRAAKQDYAVSALAMCARSGDQATKKAAYDVLNRVCRIPTQLFQFIELCQTLSPGGSSGWGRAHRNAICNWYQHFGDQPLKLAQLVTKYRKRNKWSHRDVLRLAHLKPISAGVEVVSQYVAKGLGAAVKAYPVQDDTPTDIVKTLSLLKAVEEVKKLGNSEDGVARVCDAIRSHNLVREHVPTQLLKSAEIWNALLVNMPLNALIRNLGKMTSLKMFETESEVTDLVIEKLGNEKALEYARIHPFSVLLAMSIYRQGRGDLGNLNWRPNKDIIKALDHAFYMAIKHVEPTGKRFLLAIDVGSSMASPVMGSNAINARQAAAALSLITASREDNCEIVGFSDTMKPVNIKPGMELHEVIDIIKEVPAGRTDCAAPMQWAQQDDKEFDVFIVFTDCKTEIGQVSPAKALRDYRLHSGISRAKLIVCALASNSFTLADREDPDMLDMAGFDGNAPAVMNTFITAM